MNKQLKIIIVGPGYPYRNGQSIYLSSLCNQLVGEFKVELINYTMLYPKFLFPGTTQYDESLDRKVSFPNIRMLNSLNPLSWIKTARYINASRADIIAIDWWHPFFGICLRGLTFFLNSQSRKKVIFITENVISHEANKLDKLLTRIGLKDSQCFLALSETVEKQLSVLFDKKIFRSTLPIYDFYQREDVDSNSTKNAKSVYGFHEDDTVFLFFGLVRKYKGLDLLIEAFSSLKSKNPKVKLLIVGEFYEDPSFYINLIKERDLENHVILENRYIPDEEVAPFFEAADCVMLPYRSATQSGILSMAYGFRKPVIVTPVGELATLVVDGETGFVAKSIEIKEIEKTMSIFLQHKNEHFPFRKFIEKHLTENNEFENINNIFNDIHAYLQSKLNT